MALLILPRGGCLLGRYIQQMFPKKIQRPGPGCGIGFRSITVPTFAIKGMARIRIKIELMGLA